MQKNTQITLFGLLSVVMAFIGYKLGGKDEALGFFALTWLLIGAIALWIKIAKGEW